VDAARSKIAAEITRIETRIKPGLSEAMSRRAEAEDKVKAWQARRLSLWRCRNRSSPQG
jgi:hypothetical protein